MEYSREDLEGMIDSLIFVYRRGVMESRHVDHIDKAITLLEGLLPNTISSKDVRQGSLWD